MRVIIHHHANEMLQRLEGPSCFDIRISFQFSNLLGEHKNQSIMFVFW